MTIAESAQPRAGDAALTGYVLASTPLPVSLFVLAIGLWALVAAATFSGQREKMRRAPSTPDWGISRLQSYAPPGVVRAALAVLGIAICALGVASFFG